VTPDDVETEIETIEKAFKEKLSKDITWSKGVKHDLGFHGLWQLQITATFNMDLVDITELEQQMNNDFTDLVQSVEILSTMEV
jgi:translation elongation factor EF-1beta